MDKDSAPASSKFGVSRIVMLVLFLTTASFIYFYIDTRAVLQQFLLRVQQDRWGSLLTFLAMYTASVPLLFPCMVLQVVSGALYGFSYGFWVSWIATSVGQTLAFILGRYLFRGAVNKYLHQTWPRFPVIDAAIRKSAWKLVCLLRLSPVLPYNILNYALAMTPVSFMAYTGASAVASIPWTMLYVYLGTFSTNLVDLAHGHIPYSTNSKLLVSALSLVVIIVTSVYGYVVSQRAIIAVLKDAEDQMSTEKSSCKCVDSDVSVGLDSGATPARQNAEILNVEAPLQVAPYQYQLISVC